MGLLLDEIIFIFFLIYFKSVNPIDNSHVFHHFFFLVEFLQSELQRFFDHCVSLQILVGFHVNYFSNHMVRFRYDAASLPLDHA